MLLYAQMHCICLRLIFVIPYTQITQETPRHRQKPPRTRRCEEELDSFCPNHILPVLGLQGHSYLQDQSCLVKASVVVNPLKTAMQSLSKISKFRDLRGADSFRELFACFVATIMNRSSDPKSEACASDRKQTSVLPRCDLLKQLPWSWSLCCSAS